MNLHFVDRLPVLGYREIDGRDLAFAWAWHTPCLRVTFTEGELRLLGQVVELDHCPRLVAAPDNLDWLRAADPERVLGVLEHAADLWGRKEHLFRTCEG
ncbi:hypothetical protein [Glycomyces arizonensis]|uniref:hypothetical protein n=1 Tax=Glycomyces arizonensis TaxID=256035 RepID=UPI000410DD15|nr:hypothetical protein [Glycomyces arizonensis]